MSTGATASVMAAKHDGRNSYANGQCHGRRRTTIPTGTPTDSVIVGQGTFPDGIVGLASNARLVPIRATESVVQVFDTDVAKAVAHARQVGCHVVTMGLGGKGFFGLHGEIQRAVDAGMIVMAAAGNYVHTVTAPASYDNCLAVAATGPADVGWVDSSRGTAVDVSMPGSCVYVAAYSDRTPIVRMGNGTSFAVAHLAAGAAWWLAHHGRRPGRRLALLTRRRDGHASVRAERQARRQARHSRRRRGERPAPEAGPAAIGPRARPATRRPTSRRSSGRPNSCS